MGAGPRRAGNVAKPTGVSEPGGASRHPRPDALIRPANGEWANREGRMGKLGRRSLYSVLANRYSLLASLAGGAVRRSGGAARHGGAVERHALDAAAEDLCLLRGQRARVDAHPGDLGGQPAVLDLRAA